MTLLEKLGNTIIRLRKLHGLSQEQFAFESNIDRRYMSDLENGKRNVSIDVLERISKSLGISASTLLYEAEQESQSQDSKTLIKKRLHDKGYNDVVLFEEPSFTQAIIGVSKDGRIIYSYEKMIDYLLTHKSMTHQEAEDLIGSITSRALPNQEEKTPIIMNSIHF